MRKSKAVGQVLSWGCHEPLKCPGLPFELDFDPIGGGLPYMPLRGRLTG